MERDKFEHNVSRQEHNTVTRPLLEPDLLTQSYEYQPLATTSPTNSPFGNTNINNRLHCSTCLGLGKAWGSFQLEYPVAHTHERGKAFGKGAVGHFSTAWADKTGKLPGWIGNTLEVHAFFAHEHQFRRYLDSWDTLTKNAWFIAMFVIHDTRAQVPWPRNQLNLGIATYLGSFLKVICITLLLFTSTLHWRRNRLLLTTQNSLFSSTTPIFACGVFKQICNFFSSGRSFNSVWI